MAQKAEKELNAKQKLFIHHYLNNGFNATQAAISAKYSKKTSAVIGCENLIKPNIKTEIKRQIDEIIDSEKSGLKLRVKQELEQCSFSSVGDYIDDSGQIDIDKVKTINSGAVKEYTVTTLKTITGKDGADDQEVLRHSIKLHGKDKPLEVLSKHTGLLEEQGTKENPLHMIITDKLDGF